MAKQGEIDYLRNIGPEGQEHAFNKPFSDINCGRYLVDLGIIMSLMPPPPAKLLDLGAGTGWTSVFFARRGFNVVGQDIAPDAIELANKNKERNNLNNLDFVQNDYEKMSFREEFDIAIFYDSLHHCIDEEKAMQSAYDALRKGGILITVEPGEGHANSEASKRTVEKFGVTEKDMPPRLIISVGKKIGFKRAQVYRRYINPVELMCQPRSILRGLYYLFKLHLKGMHDPNIVVLTK